MKTLTQIEQQRLAIAIKDIIWMARRYAHNRSTYAPEMFNDAYDTIRTVLGDEIEKGVIDDSMNHFPYASDGGGDKYQEKIKDRPFYKK